jgi:hypothetical protein
MFPRGSSDRGVGSERLLSNEWLMRAMTNAREHRELAKQHLSNHQHAASTRPDLELELSVH